MSDLSATMNYSPQNNRVLSVQERKCLGQRKMAKGVSCGGFSRTSDLVGHLWLS